jgi:hypothetical protein
MKGKYIFTDGIVNCCLVPLRLWRSASPTQPDRRLERGGQMHRTIRRDRALPMMRDFHLAVTVRIIVFPAVLHALFGL